MASTYVFSYTMNSFKPPISLSTNCYNCVSIIINIQYLFQYYIYNDKTNKLSQYFTPSGDLNYFFGLNKHDDQLHCAIHRQNFFNFIYSIFHETIINELRKESNANKQRRINFICSNSNTWCSHYMITYSLLLMANLINKIYPIDVITCNYPTMRLSKLNLPNICFKENMCPSYWYKWTMHMLYKLTYFDIDESLDTFEPFNFNNLILQTQKKAIKLTLSYALNSYYKRNNNKYIHLQQSLESNTHIYDIIKSYL